MKPYAIAPDAELYFCTDTIVGWQYVFMSPEFFDVIIRSLKYCQTHKDLRIHAYVIMPNHVHTILLATNNKLSSILRDYKRFSSKEISKLLGTDRNKRLQSYFARAASKANRGNEYKVWQRGSHPEAIISRDFFLQKLNYIHENPVRKGYVEKAEHWLYSSARNYYSNDHSLIQIDILE